MTLRGYVICSTPRSGTNYLCDLLASTGELGRPQDWFNGAGIRARGDADYPLDPRLQLRQVLARGTTANGVYGMKMFCEGFDRLAGLDWVSTLPALHWICLERRDVLGQAISDVRSTQTQQFRSTAPTLAPPRYDSEAIRASLDARVREQARWELFFGRNGLQPLRLIYEEVTADPQRAVDSIAFALGLAPAPRIRPQELSLEVQRDAISLEWRTRFLATEHDLTRLDKLPTPLTLRARRRLSRLWQRTKQ